jgi:hypothetical protein
MDKPNNGNMAWVPHVFNIILLMAPIVFSLYLFKVFNCLTWYVISANRIEVFVGSTNQSHSQIPSANPVIGFDFAWTWLVMRTDQLTAQAAPPVHNNKHDTANSIPQPNTFLNCTCKQRYT